MKTYSNHKTHNCPEKQLLTDRHTFYRWSNRVLQIKQNCSYFENDPKTHILCVELLVFTANTSL